MIGVDKTRQHNTTQNSVDLNLTTRKITRTNTCIAPAAAIVVLKKSTASTAHQHHDIAHAHTPTKIKEQLWTVFFVSVATI